VIIRLIFSLLFILPLNAFAGMQEDFQSAADLYDQGEFNKAVGKFESIIDRGYVTSELYYNLGCAQFKAGKLGKAIASFRRAERLAPDDEDIKANSQFLKLFVVDKIETGEEKFIPDKLLRTLSTLHPNSYFWLSILTILIAFIALSLRKIGSIGKIAYTIASVLFVVTILLVGAMSWVMDANYLTAEGVIIAEETDILSGPGTEFELQFTAHEGLLFKVLESKNQYYLGLFANKLKGWVKISDAEKI